MISLHMSVEDAGAWAHGAKDKSGSRAGHDVLTVGEMAILVPILVLKVIVAGKLVPMVTLVLELTVMVIPNMKLMEMVIGPNKVTASLVPILLDILLVNEAFVLLEKLFPLLARMTGLMAMHMVAESKTLMLMVNVLHLVPSLPPVCFVSFSNLLIINNYCKLNHFYRIKFT